MNGNPSELHSCEVTKQIGHDCAEESWAFQGQMVALTLSLEKYSVSGL